MNRLWLQLTLAFTLVVLVAVGAIAFLVNETTGNAFRQYVTHSDVRASGTGVQRLIAYYQQQGTWEGVEILLGEGIFVDGPANMPGLNRERMAIRPPLRLDVLLADADGRVVFDSAGRDQGRRLSSRERAQALPITETDDSQPLGYLLISLPSGRDPLGRLEQAFLARMRAILITAGMLAVLLGLVMGALLSQSLTAPLRRLAAAARAVAAGQLDHRVRVEGSAEMADVARAFNEMTTALAESERQRRNMVADVAHELRTPLTVLQGNLRAILDGVYPLDNSEVSRLYDESRLLGRLVDDLRELALADAGQLRLNLVPTDVAGVIRSTVESLLPAAEAEGVTLTAAPATSLPAARADPDRLAQVLRNLLINALRHTPTGGSVTVSAKRSNDELQIAVVDTGEGIAAEDLPHIFERFWRADPSRARTGGTGLGLSVAHSLVEAQGGRLWAESQLGEGSTFRFTVPTWPPGG